MNVHLLKIWIFKICSGALNTGGSSGSTHVSWTPRRIITSKVISLFSHLPLFCRDFTYLTLVCIIYQTKRWWWWWWGWRRRRKRWRKYPSHRWVFLIFIVGAAYLEIVDALRNEIKHNRWRSSNSAPSSNPPTSSDPTSKISTNQEISKTNKSHNKVFVFILVVVDIGPGWNPIKSMLEIYYFTDIFQTSKSNITNKSRRNKKPTAVTTKCQ